MSRILTKIISIILISSFIITNVGYCNDAIYYRNISSSYIHALRAPIGLDKNRARSAFKQSKERGTARLITRKNFISYLGLIVTGLAFGYQLRYLFPFISGELKNITTTMDIVVSRDDLNETLMDIMNKVEHSIKKIVEPFKNNVGLNITIWADGIRPVAFSYNGEKGFLVGSSIKLLIYLSVIDDVLLGRYRYEEVEENLRKMCHYSDNKAAAELLNKTGILNVRKMTKKHYPFTHLNCWSAGGYDNIISRDNNRMAPNDAANAWRYIDENIPGRYKDFFEARKTERRLSIIIAEAFWTYYLPVDVNHFFGYFQGAGARCIGDTGLVVINTKDENGKPIKIKMAINIFSENLSMEVGYPITRDIAICVAREVSSVFSTKLDKIKEVASKATVLLPTFYLTGKAVESRIKHLEERAKIEIRIFAGITIFETMAFTGALFAFPLLKEFIGGLFIITFYISVFLFELFTEKAKNRSSLVNADLPADVADTVIAIRETVQPVSKPVDVESLSVLLQNERLAQDSL